MNQSSEDDHSFERCILHSVLREDTGMLRWCRRHLKDLTKSCRRSCTQRAGCRPSLSDCLFWVGFLLRREGGETAGPFFPFRTRPRPRPPPPRLFGGVCLFSLQRQRGPADRQDDERPLCRLTIHDAGYIAGAAVPHDPWSHAGQYTMPTTLSQRHLPPRILGVRRGLLRVACGRLRGVSG